LASWPVDYPWMKDAGDWIVLQEGEESYGFTGLRCSI